MQKNSLSSVKNKTLGKVILYRVFFVWHSAKNFFCRVPKKHSAKNLKVGKDGLSGSDNVSNNLKLNSGMESEYVKLERTIVIVVGKEF
jgi:hypothetical protein